MSCTCSNATPVPGILDRARRAYPSVGGGETKEGVLVELPRWICGSDSIVCSRELNRRICFLKDHCDAKEKMERVFAQYKHGMIPLEGPGGIVSVIKQIVDRTFSPPTRPSFQEEVEGRESRDHRRETKGKSVVFFIGPSQVGKSTTVNRLLGFPAKLIAGEDLFIDRQTNNPDLLVMMPTQNSKGEVVYPPAKVGIGNESETEEPSLYHPNTDTRQISYYDCPGCTDSRGIGGQTNTKDAVLFEVRNALQVQRALNATESIRGFAVFIKYPSLFGDYDQGKQCREGIIYLSDLFRHSLESYEESLWIVITQPSKNWRGKSNVDHGKVCELLRKTIEKGKTASEEEAHRGFYSELDEWIRNYPERVLIYDALSDEDTEYLRQQFESVYVPNPLSTPGRPASMRRDFGCPLGADGKITTIRQANKPKEEIVSLISRQSERQMRKEKDKVLRGSPQEKAAHRAELKQSVARLFSSDGNPKELLEGQDLDTWEKHLPVLELAAHAGGVKLTSFFSSVVDSHRDSLQDLAFDVELEDFSRRDLLRKCWTGTQVDLQKLDDVLKGCQLALEKVSLRRAEILQRKGERACERVQFRDFLQSEVSQAKISDYQKKIQEQLKSGRLNTIDQLDPTALGELIRTVVPMISLNSLTDASEEELMFFRQLLENTVVNPLYIEHIPQTGSSSRKISLKALSERVCISSIIERLKQENLDAASIILEVVHPEKQGVLYFNEDLKNLTGLEGKGAYIKADQFIVAPNTRRIIDLRAREWYDEQSRVTLEGKGAEQLTIL